jgi:hypothetical protein
MWESRFGGGCVVHIGTDPAFAKKPSQLSARGILARPW